MGICYDKLWQRLKRENLKKKDLLCMTGISSRTIAKLGHNDNVTMDLLVKICEALHCKIDDICEIISETKNPKSQHSYTKRIKFIDLFAGIGGIRKGFELACERYGYQTECVLTSEIKPHAIEILHQNHPSEEILGDITTIKANEIPDFDFLLAGFPCQAFSAAGKRLGFLDTRGTLFLK